MTGAEPEPSKASFLLLFAAAVAFFCGLVVVGLGPGFRDFRLSSVLLTIIFESMWVAAWLFAAYGWGFVLRRTLGQQADARVQLSLGCGLHMLLAWLCGSFGVLNTAAAWGLILAGGVLAAFSFKAEKFPLTFTVGKSKWYLLSLLPAAGLLIGASTIAPGALWFSEFSGWDALAYHLQLPLEWQAQGKIEVLNHNVYSCLPNLVEAGFLHLGVLRGEMRQATFACQMLHAAFAVIAAGCLCRVTEILLLQNGKDPECAQTAGLISGALYIALPWTIITGSLAYTDQAVMMFASAAALLIAADKKRNARCVFSAGILLGFAVLAKISSALLLAVPIALVLLIVENQSRWRHFGLLTAGTIVICVPWLIRNWLQIGNPVFPIAADLLGLAHWDVEQAKRFNSLFHQKIGIAKTISAATQHFLWAKEFGFVAVPFALITSAYLLTQCNVRKIAVLAVATLTLQIVLWASFTHQLPRFLIPAAIPVMLIAGLFAAMGRLQLILASVVVIAASATSFQIYFSEPGTPTVAIDGVGFMLAEAQPYKTLNELPPGSKVYAEGFATPYYVDVVIDYHTVWDASKLGKVLRHGDEKQAIAWLRESGYTHMIIDWGMLETWLTPGNYGYDSNISLEKLRSMCASLPVLFDGKFSRCSIFTLR